MEATQEDMERYEGHPRQQLAAMTHALDRGVGAMVSALKMNGLFDNTLIFFPSDNGGAYNNQSSNFPLKGFKGNEYEGGHRVPFFVSWPAKIKKAGSFKGLTSSLDIYPTCLDAAGKTDHAGKALDGTSLIPFLTGVRNGSPHDGDRLKQFDGWVAFKENEIGHLRNQVNEEVGKARSQLFMASEQLELSEESQLLAKEAVEQSIQRQQLGTAKPFEVFQAQEIYLRARLDYLKAIASYNKAQYSLFVALGNNL